jgi:hypothetical protein
MRTAGKPRHCAYQISGRCLILGSGTAKFCLAIVCFALLSRWPAPLAAQENGSHHLLPNLAARLSVVHFFIADGRIEATGLEAGLEREQTSTGGSDRQEKLAFSTNADQEASIEYELSSATELVTVEVIDGRQVTLARHPAKDNKATAQVDFTQPNDGPLSLTVTDHGVVRRVGGPTLWHLLVSEPELCRRHLLPLLEMLRSDWHLTEVSQAVEAQMVRTAEAYQPENLQRWSALVADLASEKFTVRQGAERQLRAAGSAVFPFLQGLDRGKLDFEQCSRIQRILESRYGAGEDTAELAASELMTDRLLWVDLADRPQASVRHAAARQLAFLLGENPRFNPDASADIRRAQLAALRRRIEIAVPVESN